MIERIKTHGEHVLLLAIWLILIGLCVGKAIGEDGYGYNLRPGTNYFLRDGVLMEWYRATETYSYCGRCYERTVWKSRPSTAVEKYKKQGYNADEAWDLGIQDIIKSERKYQYRMDVLGHLGVQGLLSSRSRLEAYRASPGYNDYPTSVGNTTGGFLQHERFRWGDPVDVNRWLERNAVLQDTMIRTNGDQHKRATEVTQMLSGVNQEANAIAGRVAETSVLKEAVAALTAGLAKRDEQLVQALQQLKSPPLEYERRTTAAGGQSSYQPSSEPADRRSEAVGLIQKYCGDCHSPGNSQGRVPLYPGPGATSIHPSTIADVKIRLNQNSQWKLTNPDDGSEMLFRMPPENQPQPTADERAAIVAWYDQLPRK